MLFTTLVSAQEAHILFNRVNMGVYNPAFTGTQGSFLSINSRFQWSGIKDAPKTNYLLYYLPKKKNVYLGFTAYDSDANGDGFDDNQIFVSEVLTPNTYGFESSWRIINIEQYSASRVEVYNRNGQRVFQKKNYQNDWGGVYQNKGGLLPVGSYYYRIDLGDGTPIREGWIYLTY